MIYDVTSHAALSQAAKDLDPAALEVQATIAESILGLVDTAYTEPKYDRAATAIALQINYQLEAGTEGFVVQSASRGARSLSYRSAGKKGLPVAHPLAKKIADGLKPVRRLTSAR